MIIFMVPVGFYTKFYSGPFSEWVHNSLGGVIYVIFWSLLFYLLAPNVNPLKIASSVFIITCILEFMQLWHPPFLEVVRKNFLGRALIGSSFSWLDMVHYIIGFFISYSFIILLRKIETGNSGMS